MADESVMELDDSHWETVVEKSEKPVVVMFYDQLCPHCMIMMPHFEKYAEDLGIRFSSPESMWPEILLPSASMGSWPLQLLSSFAKGVQFKRSWERFIQLY